MKELRFVEGLNVQPVLAPIDTAASAVATAYTDLKLAEHLTYLVQFGNMTSDSTDTATITLECSTAGSSNATELALAYQYRLSGAIGTNSWGAITSATSAGAAFAADSVDGKVVCIEVDPAAVANAGADYRHVRLVVTPSAATAICIVGAQAFIEPRYAGNAIPSSS